jgi:hypothetical protein
MSGTLAAINYFPLATALEAQVVAKSTAITSSYVDVSGAQRVYALINFGDLDSGTVTIDFLQAKDTSGTDAKALTAGGFAQQTSAVDDTPVEAEGDVSDLDGANLFKTVAIRLTTNASVAADAAYMSAALFLVNPDYRPQS